VYKRQFYTRWGDWLPELCAIIGVMLLFLAALRRTPVALK